MEKATAIKKRYTMLAIDPPWPKWQKGARGAQKHYDLMTMEEITNLPIGDLTTENFRMFFPDLIGIFGDDPFHIPG